MALGACNPSIGKDGFKAICDYYKGSLRPPLGTLDLACENKIRYKTLELQR